MFVRVSKNESENRTTHSKKRTDDPAVAAVVAVAVAVVAARCSCCRSLARSCLRYRLTFFLDSDLSLLPRSLLDHSRSYPQRSELHESKQAPPASSFAEKPSSRTPIRAANIGDEPSSLSLRPGRGVAQCTSSLGAEPPPSRAAAAATAGRGGAAAAAAVGRGGAAAAAAVGRGGAAAAAAAGSSRVSTRAAAASSRGPACANSIRSCSVSMMLLIKVRCKTEKAVVEVERFADLEQQRD